MPVLVLITAVPALAVLALAVLTAIGARRRGGGWPVVVASGALFPLAWVAWYLVDDRSARAH
ncbi:hypothetical protein RDV89_05625 [Nocardioides zeae]|uniref:Cardiolipin synthase N-terminal domain-containing protein n=1 Tax=Nocardioides imazamoxiresistens TaxID=3231893 RepID=A0ABU3PTH8_9ACTN|nr:hypothetical protein [Nocardioides zeae]MDT9592537.1 hypothetical protein [Nocardioides zeae]